MLRTFLFSVLLTTLGAASHLQAQRTISPNTVSPAKTTPTTASPAKTSPATISPADPTLNQAYLKPRNIFQRLTWMNKEGKVYAQATLNCITRIDSVNKKLTYLQIRNDGKKDSTSAEWPSLKPFYTSTTYPAGKQIYDYRDGQAARIMTIANGKTIQDTSFTLSGPFFDGFLTDYLLGALPLKAGYQARFQTCSGVKSATLAIKQVLMDVLVLGDGHLATVFSVTLDYDGFTVLYSIDKSTGDLLKSVVQTPDGGLFIKSKI